MQSKHTPTEYERDNADDDLNRIKCRKEEMTDWLDDVRRSYTYAVGKNMADFDLFAASVEEQFDDLFYHEWHRLKEISQSIEWTAQIPTCEVLRAAIAQKRRDAAGQRLGGNKTALTNPASLIATGQL